MGQWSNHQARVFASQLVRCLSDVDRLKLVLSPKREKLLGHTKRGADVVDRDWPALAQLLKNWLQVFLWLQLLLLEARV